MSNNNKVNTDPIKIVDDQPSPVIHNTKNYKLFRNLEGNRQVSEGHLFQLTKAIAKNNLLPYEPIVVNEKMEVIDGQHRLKIAEANNLTIYYVIAKGTKLEDVQMINSSAKPWTAHDYLRSYVRLKKPAYIKLQQYVETYGLTISNALVFFSKGKWARWSMFKRGEFTIDNEEAAEMMINAYAQMKPYVESVRVWNDREFVRAVQQLANKISIDEFIAKLEVYGSPIEYQATTKNYLRVFEEVVNFRMRKNNVRLF